MGKELDVYRSSGWILPPVRDILPVLHRIVYGTNARSLSKLKMVEGGLPLAGALSIVHQRRSRRRRRAERCPADELSRSETDTQLPVDRIGRRLRRFEF